MFKKLLTLCVVLLSINGIAAAQRSLTNADLERYRDARVRANLDYRQNYEKLGMPSPEELDRRRESYIHETSQVATRLREHRLEQEKLDLQRYDLETARAKQLMDAYAQQQAARFYDASFLSAAYGAGGFYGGGYYDGGYYGGGDFGRPGRFFGRDFIPQQGYYAGGQYWPTGNRTPMLPMIRGGVRINGGGNPGHGGPRR